MNTSKSTIPASASADGATRSPAARTRNGKIARLPLEIREQLNRRLDDGEQGQPVLDWLNALPEAQALSHECFGGVPVSEQNLSQWRRGGYRDWQKQRERRDMVRQWTEDAKDLRREAGEGTFSSSFSMILLAELAQALRDALEEATDATTRLERLHEVAGRFAQLRREQSNAERVRVACERWKEEQATTEALQDAGGASMPLHALLLQQLYIDRFSRAAETKVASGQNAGLLLDPCQSSAPDDKTRDSK